MFHTPNGLSTIVILGVPLRTVEVNEKSYQVCDASTEELMQLSLKIGHKGRHLTGTVSTVEKYCFDIMVEDNTIEIGMSYDDCLDENNLFASRMMNSAFTAERAYELQCMVQDMKELQERRMELFDHIFSNNIVRRPHWEGTIPVLG